MVMVDRREAKWKCGEGQDTKTKYKLSEHPTTEKGKDGRQVHPPKSSRCFKGDPCVDLPHPEHPSGFDWESNHCRINDIIRREKEVRRNLMPVSPSLQ